MRKIGIIFLIGTFLLLNACSTIKKDGPPSYNVDVSKIPDAVPKTEPRSQYGNLDTYRVFGKKYHVMTSSKNYEEKGIASWYGTKFHAQRTSSGERYNMLAMTAAHKTLPLPTYVQVTNLHNGKKIIVKVNDRGPFESNRLIDLSYVAAKKLGMLGHGTTYVDVKAIDPHVFNKNTFDLVKNTRENPTSAVYLQVGAFKNRMLAEHMKTRVRKIISSPIKITQLTHHKKLYRVQIGPIKDVATAKHITKQLKAVGLDTKQTPEEV